MRGAFFTLSLAYAQRVSAKCSGLKWLIILMARGEIASSNGPCQHFSIANDQEMLASPRSSNCQTRSPMLSNKVHKLGYDWARLP